MEAIRLGLAAGPLLLLMAGSCVCQDGDLAPWAGNAHPSDARKQHVEEISSGKHEYMILQSGTMDGTNCRSQMGCGMSREGALEQTWESNRSVRMENVGDTDVVNPWLSNGRNNYRTLAEIVSAAVADGMSNKEKAFALWWQRIQYRFHGNGEDNTELCDPVKVFNIYGHNTCGNDSICMAGEWAQAGLKAAPARAVGHCISQVSYDGAWHFLDSDQHAVYLLRDNETVAGEQEFTRDHDLIRRSHTQGILFPDSRAAEEDVAAMYLFEGPVTGERRCKMDTTMNMVLRPGEALIWRWGHLNPAKCQSGAKLPYPDTICNGLWEYRPDFSKETWRKGADGSEAIKAGPDGLAAEEGKEGSVVWSVRSPYVFVGGRLEVEGQGAKFALSFDGKAWLDVGEDLDKALAAKGPGRYQYQVRCQLSGGARLKRLAIISDLQMAPLVLPGMVVGENRFAYTDESKGDRKVRVAHAWVERSASRPPAAPPQPVAPADGGEANGTDVVFKWTPPADPDGDKIADYHFELSNRADMKWPLSLSFAKMISRTADTGKAQYTLPCAGLLAPDTKYYWRVRAKGDKGVWGPWSKTWSFTPRGPSYPLEVAVDFDQAKGIGTLRWKSNPVGRKPAKYRIYGSDEKGFSASDEPYKVNLGACKELSSPFPANFIAETAATELAVLGAGVELPAAHKTYYRVVAVDEQGKRSGPSDFATAPRPVVYSKPVTAAKVGAEYRYQAAANRSLGDLRMNPQQARSFWDIEKPKFALSGGPKWLKIDAATGLLSGTPDAPGKFEAAVSVTLERPVRKVDESALKWGNLKVNSTSIETLGPATQKFVIEVGG
ncbi:MAG: putative Ig domain-containing protein [Planctomycetota bacterium]